MNYIKLVCKIADRYQEPFIAELMDLDFYGFEQFDDKLIAYVEKPRYNDSNRELIEQKLAGYLGASFIEIEDVAEKNWNETWEQSIQPQRVGRFLVKPTWSGEKPTEDEILLEIDPKMAFGTGYHATTRLMLRGLQNLNLKNQRVLDAGTGTGILAIAAVKLGAQSAIGFDIDPWSEQNAAENILINRVSDAVEIRLGSIDQIHENEMFDATLANINRNVILELIPMFVKHTQPGGTIYLTGLLEADEDIIRKKLSDEPVQIEDIFHEEEWILFSLKKDGL